MCKLLILLVELLLNIDAMRSHWISDDSWVVEVITIDDWFEGIGCMNCSFVRFFLYYVESCAHGFIVDIEEIGSYMIY